jgi:hypothetical protein
MYKKFGLSVAIALATVLGAGCGQGKSSAEAEKGQVNKLPSDLEVAQKRRKVVEMFVGKCIECGIAEEKLRKYQPGLEKYSDNVAEGTVQGLSISNGLGAEIIREEMRSMSQVRKEQFLLSLSEEFKTCTDRIWCGVSTREDLISSLIRNSAWEHAELALVMDDLGISDNHIISLRNAFLQEEFMDGLLYALSDLVFASIVKEGKNS